MKANSLGLIVIAGALFFMFGKPQLSGLESLNQQKQAYNKAIEDMRIVEETKNSLLAKMDSASAEDLKKVEVMLPEKPSIVSLVSEIDGVASKQGLHIKNISTNQSANFSATISEGSQQKLYNSITLSFDFDGSYENLKYLLTELESSMRILDIRSIDFSANDKGGLNTYKVSMDLYWVAPAVQAPGSVDVKI